MDWEFVDQLSSNKMRRENARRQMERRDCVTSPLVLVFDLLSISSVVCVGLIYFVFVENLFYFQPSFKFEGRRKQRFS